MPEGDTIHYAAGRMRPILAGRVPDELLNYPARSREGKQLRVVPN